MSAPRTLIRAAVDGYLEHEVGEPDGVVSATFGALPDLQFDIPVVTRIRRDFERVRGLRLRPPS